MKARILLVDADGEMIQILSALLAADNFEVDTIADGPSAIVKASTGDFDLIILGATLTGMTGFAVCDELRRKGIDTSILLLTAKSRSEERVRGLRLGADDCIARSCDVNELLARVDALLRRVPRARKSPVTRLHFGVVEIDFARGEAMKAGRPVTMTSRELRLLRYLVDHRDRVVSRNEILRQVWEYDSAVSSRTVDVHIGWLRQKLEDNPQQPRYLKTIRGRGYRFDADDQASGLGAWSSTLTSVSLL